MSKKHIEEKAADVSKEDVGQAADGAQDLQEGSTQEKPVRKKKFGPVKTSVCIVSAAAVVALGVWAGIAFLRPQEKNDVDLGYTSVSYEVKEGEIFTPSAFVSELKQRDENGNVISGDENTYDGLDVFGRLNWTFAQEDNWYSEMHSVVNTMVGPQDVATYKRYADGILISTDITTSSMVNVAREYCYVGDRVIWRDSEDSVKNWNGMDTVFPDKDPSGNMEIYGEDGFRKKNGLPATELSVYIFEQNTIESCTLTEGNVPLADGEKSYTLTYRLIAKTDEEGKTGAAAYYGNQMVFTGGIDAPPEFDFIEVSYTFTENWVPLQCNVSESYSASMKTLSTKCTSTSETKYTYDVPELSGQIQEIYTGYYREKLESAPTGQTPRPLTATDCLASAFGSMLMQPATLDLALTVDGVPMQGTLWIDLGPSAASGSLDLNTISARLAVGNVLNVWLDQGRAYVRYSDVRVSMSVGDLMAMVSGGAVSLAADTEEAGQDILSELMAGTFSSTDTTAQLFSEIELGGQKLGLKFFFRLDGSRNASLDRVELSVALDVQAGTFALSADVAGRVSFGQNPPAELAEADRAAYTDLKTFAGQLQTLLSSDVLHVEVGYRDDGLGLAVEGGADIAVQGGFQGLKGEFTLTYADHEKQLLVQSDGTDVFVGFDGLKAKVGVDELLSLVSAIPMQADDGSKVELGKLLAVLLSDGFAGNFSSAEREGALTLTIKGTELLRSLFIDFALGDVTLTAGEEGIGLSALGVTATLTEGDPFVLETDGYAELLPYALNIVELFTNDAVAAELHYAGDKVTLGGRAVVSTKEPVSVSAALSLTYGQTSKDFDVYYTEGALYLAVDSLKLKVNAEEIAAVLGATPMADGGSEAEELLGRLFSMDLGSIVTSLSNPGDALEVQVALDALLKGLGFGGDLSLGTLTVTAGEDVRLALGDLSASVGKADSAPALPEHPEEYTDLTPYTGTVLALAGQEYIGAELSYTGSGKTEGLAVSGEVNLGVKDHRLSAELTASYNGKNKEIALYYVGDGFVYLTVDGLKLKADLTVLQELLSAVTASDGTSAAALADAADDPLEELLSSLGELLTVEGGDSLTVTVALDRILGAFGIGLSLGDAVITVPQDGAISLSAAGATVTLSEGRAVTPDLGGYTEVATYVKTVLGMLEGRLKAQISYTGKEISLTGEAVISPSGQVAASAVLTLGFGGTEHALTLAVQPDKVYISLDGVKFEGTPEKAASLVTLLIGAVNPTAKLPQGEISVQDVLEKLFSVDLGKILSGLKDENGVLGGLLSGDGILGMFGITADPVKVQLEVSETEKSVTLTLLGGADAGETIATLSVGETQETPLERIDGCVPADAVFDRISEILQAKGAALQGSIEVTAGSSQVIVALDNAAISWKNGFEMRLDGVLVSDGIRHRVSLYISEEKIRIAYGQVGAELAFKDLGTLRTAFQKVKDQIGAFASASGSASDPAVQALSLADAGDTLSGALDSLGSALEKLLGGTETFDLKALLAKISFSQPDEDGVLLRMQAGGISLDLVAGNMLGFTADYTADGTSVHGEFKAAPLTGELSPMPTTEYLSTKEFEFAIGYLGTAVGLLTEDYTLEIENGKTAVTTDAGETVKYNVAATLQYHNGESVPVHLDVDGKNFWIDTDLFLNVHLALVKGEGAAETDKSLYLDLFILDGMLVKDGEGKDVAVKDGNLDIYLSLSQFDSADTAYNPLRIHAPADEIMTILSGVLPMLGVDADILNSYLVNKWLTMDQVGQLKALGAEIMPLLKTLLSGLVTEGTPAAMAAAEPVDGAYIKELSIKEAAEGGDVLKLVLDSALVYGKDGLGDITVTVTRDEEGRFGSVGFNNIYDATGTEKTTIEGSFTYGEVTPVLPDGEDTPYTSFLGAEKLLLSLAKSTTHVTNADDVISGEQTQHTYALNRNFYIEGSVTADMFGVVDVTIDIVAVSVTIDENGDLGINVRLEYKGKALIAVAINGNSTVDITFKNGMVYMKRVQTTKQGLIRNESIDPITLYRAMPMENFTGDMLGQLAFILNFGDLINRAINGGTAGGETTTDPVPEENVDYGKKLDDVLTSYSFTEDAQGSKWDLKIDGSSFSDGILGNMHVIISADEDGYIRSIELPESDKTQIKIPVTNTFKLTMNANATFNWRNPGGVMEEGKTDLTSDVSKEIGSKTNGMGAMIGKLNAETEGKNGWDDPATEEKEGPVFLEGKDFTVAYKYHTVGGGAEDLGEPQTVMVSTGGDGNAENTLYSELIYPELPDKRPATYVDAFAQYGTGQVVPSEIVSQEHKCVYTVTFLSEEEIDESWQYDEGRVLYKKTVDMEYGAKVTFIAKGQEIEDSEFTVTEDNTQEVKLPEKPAYEAGQDVKSRWTMSYNVSGTEFTVLYDLDTVQYHSAVAFKLDGKENFYEDYSEQFTEESYTLITPKAEGYTFLGWYMKNADGAWEKIDSVTKGDEPATTVVEALWAADDFVTLETERSESGSILKKTYTYTATAKIDETKLVGAMASELKNGSAQYAFLIDKNAESSNNEAYGNESSKAVSQQYLDPKYTYAHVKVKVTYTIGDKPFEFEIEQYKAF